MAEPDERAREIAQLPTMLAIPLDRYRREDHPLVKLWRLCELVENAYRLCLFLALAQAREAPSGIPEAFRREASSRIDRPSLGVWMHMAERAAGLDGVSGTIGNFLAEARRLFQSRRGGTFMGENIHDLRNALAHRHVDREQAENDLRIWAPVLDEFLDGCGWLRSLRLAGRGGDGRVRLLRGYLPRGVEAAAEEEEMFPDLGRGQVAAFLEGGRWTLWPLLRFAPDSDGDAPFLIQMYHRRERDYLDYLSFGQRWPTPTDDGLADFLALFSHRPGERALLSPFSRATADAVAAWTRHSAGVLRGREEAMEDLRRQARHEGGTAHIVLGPAGMGKTLLLGAFADELGERPDPDTFVIAYRFRANRLNCSEERFLLYVRERLEEWEEGVERPAKGFRETPDPWERLAKVLGALRPGRRVYLILDGLDEIARGNRRIPAKLDKLLRCPALCVLASCRNPDDAGLAAARIIRFRAAPGGAEETDALPPLSRSAMRALIMDEVQSRAEEFIRAEENSGRIGEADFFDAVERRSGGLPLYVGCLIEDLKKGVYNPGNPDCLPESIGEYFKKLVRDMSIGGAARLVNDVAFLTAASREDLSVDDILDLLSLDPIIGGGLSREDVEAALRRLTAVVSRTGSEAGARHSIYHDALREVMAGDALAKGWTRRLVEAAEDFAPGCYKRYLYRCGVGHLCASGKAAVAARLLGDFEYVMARLRATGGGAADVADLYSDLERAREAGGGVPEEWLSFYRSARHLLMRADAFWPAYKIFLQLAAEEAEDGPVARAADAWLATGACDWRWLRCARRAAAGSARIDVVLEGHDGPILDVVAFDASRRVVSRGADGRILLWSTADGSLLREMPNHGGNPFGVAARADGGEFLTWGGDDMAARYDADGNCLARLDIDCGPHGGVAPGPDGDAALLWNKSGALRLWRFAPDRVEELPGHGKAVRGAAILSPDSAVSWGYDRRLIFWRRGGGDGGWTGRDLCAPAAVPSEGAYVPYPGALVLPGGGFLSWSDGDSVRAWTAGGEPAGGFSGQDAPILGMTLLLGGERALSLNLDHELEIWDVRERRLLHRPRHPHFLLRFLRNDVDEFSISPDGRHAVVPRFGIGLDLEDGAYRRVESHGVSGALTLGDGRLLLCHQFGHMIIRSPAAGAEDDSPWFSLFGATDKWSRVAAVYPDRSRFLTDEGGELVIRGLRGERIDAFSVEGTQPGGALPLADDRGVLVWEDSLAAPNTGAWLREPPDGGLKAIPCVLGVAVAASVLPDGRRVLLRGHLNCAVWNGETGEVETAFPRVVHGVSGSVLCGDGRHVLMTPAVGFRAWIWDAASPRVEPERREFPFHCDVVMAYDRFGKLLLIDFCERVGILDREGGAADPEAIPFARPADADARSAFGPRAALILRDDRTALFVDLRGGLLRMDLEKVELETVLKGCEPRSGLAASGPHCDERSFAAPGPNHSFVFKIYELTNELIAYRTAGRLRLVDLASGGVRDLALPDHASLAFYAAVDGSGGGLLLHGSRLEAVLDGGREPYDPGDPRHAGLLRAAGWLDGEPAPTEVLEWHDSWRHHVVECADGAVVAASGERRTVLLAMRGGVPAGILP